MNAATPRSILTALAVALALALTGCGTDTSDPSTSPATDDVLPPADDQAEDPGNGGDAGGAAGGTTMRVYDVTEALSADEEGSIHVSGLLIEDESGWRLCASVLESYPPQCGGESLSVDGLDPSGLPIEESGGVRWQTDATVVGEMDGDTLRVTGSPASS